MSAGPTSATLDPLAGLAAGLPPLLHGPAWGAALGAAGLALALGLLVLPRGGAVQGLTGDPHAAALSRRGIWLLRFAAGLYLAALLTLGLGQFQGLLARLPLGWLGLAGWAAAAAVFVRERRQLLALPHRRRRPSLPPGPARLAWMIGYAVLGFWLLALLAPAVAPPINYDVLEYHLGVVPHHFLTGRITPLPSVFYSAQPTATEMLYSLAAHIEGTPWGQAPGLLQWLMIVAGTGLFVQAAGALGTPQPARPWLALLLLLHPIVFRTQVDRLTDWSGALLLAAGLLVFARGWGELPGNAMRPSLPAGGTALLLGFFAGAAAGTKWTHLGTVSGPLLLLAAATGWRHPLAQLRLLSAVLCGAAATLVAALLWLPWGLWLWHERGNPFAPFQARYFASPLWDGTQLHFLLATHGAISPASALYWRNLAAQLTLDLPGPPLIALAALAVAGSGLALGVMSLTRRWGGLLPCARARITAAAWILDGQVIGLLLWGQLLHGADRFLTAPLLAALVIIGSLALRPLARRPTADMPQPMVVARTIPAPLAWLALLLVLIGGGLWHGLQWARSAPADRGYAGWLSLRTGPATLSYLGSWPQALGNLSRSDYLARTMGATPELFAAANRLPAGARVLAVNEARRYYFARDVQVVCVFDRHPLRPLLSGARSAAELRQRLRAAGYTHLLVNEYEQARLLEVHPPLSLLNNELYRRLLAEHDPRRRAAELVRAFPGEVEFTFDPLTGGELERYREFLGGLRATAVWSSSPGTTQPAMWIAAL